MSILTLDILRRLVGFDTSNPPRRISTGGIFEYIESLLAPTDFDVVLTDLGEGCVNLLAVRGAPTGLFNVHLDTVPADDHWSVDPFEFRTVDDRAIGLGVCDIKGAAACMLAAATTTDGPAALLLTSDEEAGQSCCVNTFLAEAPSFIEYVVVAEPTRCEAVSAHRGLRTCEGMFSGVASHGSLDAADTRNAVHHAAKWINAALEHAAAEEEHCFDGLRGLRLNVGVVEGGLKPNVVASSARVVFSARPLPNEDGEKVMADLCNLLPEDAFAIWRPRFTAPSLTPTEQSQQIIDKLDLTAGPAVDFWTEAALFAEAGLPSLVYGPGDIRQAHTANEWIELNQLDRATATYARLFSC